MKYIVLEPHRSLLQPILLTPHSFPNCMATSQMQRRCYTLRIIYLVLKKHFLLTLAGFACHIILYQASKSQLYKTCLILIIFEVFCRTWHWCFSYLHLSPAQACKLLSESTHRSQEYPRDVPLVFC